MGKESSPAKALEEFLNAVAASKQEYQYAYDAVNEAESQAPSGIQGHGKEE